MERTWSPGDVLAGRYHLVAIVGEGAMGWVWRARDDQLGIDVAVKMLRRPQHDPEDARDVTSDQARDRLVIEAKAVASLEHPGIVRVYDFGETPEGMPFFVMELLEGESLADIIDLRGSMPEVAAVQLMLPVVSALAAAHARGVVHRDLKPDNILVIPLDNEGARQPKVVDFGLARLVGQGSKRLTAVGALLGTPGYMAPEQAKGEPDVDARADIFGASVLLYEAITGRVPYPGLNPGEYIFSLFTTEPRSTVEAMGGDPDLWAILKKGLARDRAERWQTMNDLRAALSDWAAAKGARIDVSGTPLDRHSRSSLRPPSAPPSNPPPAAEPAPVVAPPAPVVIAPPPAPAPIAPVPARRLASVVIAFLVIAAIAAIGVVAVLRRR